MSQPQRIVWAIDPGEKPGSALHFRSKQLIKQFLRRPRTVVEPVHLFRLNPEIGPAFSSKWRTEYCMAAEDAVEGFLGKMRIEGLATPKVICLDSFSTRGAVDALCKHALDTGADLIVAQTHGRTGVSRLFMGSFAETLLFRSKVPVMLVNQQSQIAPRFDHILFPTDFGRNASAQLNRVLDLAAQFGARVTLFHSFEGLTEPTLMASIAGPTAIYTSDLARRWTDLTRRRAKHWIEIARKRGVEMKFVLDQRGRRPWTGVVGLARKSGASMIVMQSHSGPASAMFLGSTTRQVVRHSSCPVWVLKSEQRSGRAHGRTEVEARVKAA